MKPLEFSPEARDILLMIARRSLEERILHEREWDLSDPAALPASLHQPLGAFVSLKKEGRLRGCIGRFSPSAPLHETVRRMAEAAALHDLRFPPMEADELPVVTIEISVLGPLEKIHDPGQIIPGRHGILLRQGSSSGTLLPQVASEYGWTAEEFLGYCARDKAGIGWEGWREAEIYVYEAVVFSE